LPARRFDVGTTDPDDCEIVIYGGANRSARWMKRYSLIRKSVKQSCGATSAIKHDADAGQIFHQRTRFGISTISGSQLELKN
jgi:hypothetical protein